MSYEDTEGERANRAAKEAVVSSRNVVGSVKALLQGERRPKGYGGAKCILRRTRLLQEGWGITALFSNEKMDRFDVAGRLALTL